MRTAGMVHTAASRSISSHVARRTSPDRAAVSTKSSNASLVVTRAWEVRTVARASATAPWGSAPHVLDDGPLPPERLPEGVARRIVRPVAHGDRPLHHGTDPLPYPPRGLRACRARLGSGSPAPRPSSRRTRAPLRCAGTHRRADCAASPARTARAASLGAAAPAPRRRPPRPWARAGRGAARSADLRPTAPALRWANATSRASASDTSG